MSDKSVSDKARESVNRVFDICVNKKDDFHKTIKNEFSLEIETLLKQIEALEHDKHEIMLKNCAYLEQIEKLQAKNRAFELSVERALFVCRKPGMIDPFNDGWAWYYKLEEALKTQ